MPQPVPIFIILYNMFERIVSLVPSLTELLADLNMGDRVKGITKFCVHPPQWKREKISIGGTKSIDTARIIDLRPDLILASKEENVREQVEKLAGHGRLILTDVATCTDALQVINEIGTMLGKHTQALQMTAQIEQDFLALKPFLPPVKKLVVYLIWQDPYMVAGGDTFISSMLDNAGFTNFFGDRLRYPEIDLASLATVDELTIFLSSEPYPFREKHAEVMSRVLPKAVIRLVDGEIFSWYGSRMLMAADYFRTLHPV